MGDQHLYEILAEEGAWYFVRQHKGGSPVRDSSSPSLEMGWGDV